MLQSVRQIKRVLQLYVVELRVVKSRIRYAGHMRMAELSERSGVPAPTIRFYLREGLVPQGRLTSPNQAIYDESHLRRLRLVRALLDIGGLTVEAARGVIAAMEAKSGNDFAVLGQVQYGLTPRNRDTGHSAPAAQTDVDAIIERQGWRVRGDNPARASLAQAITTLRAIGRPELLDAIDDYARAADSLARREVDDVLAIDNEEAQAEAVIAGVILGDALLSALRRLAEESALANRIRP